MEHKINFEFEAYRPQRALIRTHITRCVQGALDAEGVTAPCEINVLVTNDDGIHVINRENRNIDRATDVLSFPMFNLIPGQPPQDWTEYIDPETGLVPLGDMCISIEHAVAQAKEYGHSTRREIGYLTIHSMLHLLGYDHLDEGEMKRQMRGREEAIADSMFRMHRE